MENERVVENMGGAQTQFVRGGETGQKRRAVSGCSKQTEERETMGRPIRRNKTKPICSPLPDYASVRGVYGAK